MEVEQAAEKAKEKKSWKREISKKKKKKPLGVEDRIVISVSREVSLGGVPIESAVSRIWPFSEINEEYRAMRSRLERRIERIQSRLDSGAPPDSREAFLELFLVFSEAAELIARDPCLPEELLPDDWLGLEVQDLIHRHFHMIHGLEQNDPYAYLLRLPAGVHIPLPRESRGEGT